MYDPVTARFIQEDTYLGSRNDALSLNLYTYCKNSPIRYSDPTGHNTQEDYKYQQDMFARQRKSSTRDAYDYQQDMVARRIKASTQDAYEYQTRTTASLTKQAEIAQEKKNQDNLITAIGIGALAVGCIVLGIVTMGAAVPVIAIAGAGLLGAGIGIGMTEIQDLSDNGTIDYGFNTYAGAAAGGFVAGATLPYSAGAGLAGVMGAGALSSMAGNATNQMISTGKVNASQFAIAGVTGALTCGIASMAPQTVTAVTQGVKSISSKLTASSANATVYSSAQTPVSGTQWNEYFCEKYGAENVVWETNLAETTQSMSGNIISDGSFSIVNWEGYPNGPKPEGPFRILEGEEYITARNEANTANSLLHRQDPLLKGMQIHEIQPVKFDGSPTDIANKMFLTPKEHAAYTTWWNNLLREMSGI